MNAVWAAAMDIFLALNPWEMIWRLYKCLAKKARLCVTLSLGDLYATPLVTMATMLKQLQSWICFYCWRAICQSTEICKLALHASDKVKLSELNHSELA